MVVLLNMVVRSCDLCIDEIFCRILQKCEFTLGIQCKKFVNELIPV